MTTRLHSPVGGYFFFLRRWLVIPALAALFLYPPLALPAEPSSFLKVHQVAGGRTEVFANAYIVEVERGVVVIDALLTKSASRDLRRRVDALGKPLFAVLITHGHPDHYGGVTQLVEGRPDVPVVALKGVDAI